MGKLIVIEGLDGSGKATQTAMLYSWLMATGVPCKRLTFPNYDSETSALVKLYLDGNLGGLADVGAYGASLFYTVDRYGSYLQDWKQDYLSDCVMVSDRYTTSNVAHQMSKLPPEQWDSYLDWIFELEYNKVGLPAPDRIVYLDMDPGVSQQLISARYGGDEAKKDIHEASLVYLRQCHDAALYGAKKKGWTVINCCKDDQPLSVEEIAARVREAVADII